MWKRGYNTEAYKSYTYNNIIAVDFLKIQQGWSISILAWNIPNYTIEVYEKFNEKKFLDKTEKLFLLDKVKHCIFNRIFQTPEEML